MTVNSDDLFGKWTIVLKNHITIPFDGKETSKIELGTEEASVATVGGMCLISSKVYEGNIMFIPLENISYIEHIPVKQRGAIVN